MIELVIAFVGIIALLTMKASSAIVYARKFLFEWVGVCMCIVLIGSVIIYYQSYSGTAVTRIITMGGLAANTIYLNNNFTSITIYATTNGVLHGYVGNSTTTLLIAINDTPSVASGFGVLDLPGSVTSTLVVPEGDYYLFNYSVANFTLEKVRT